jgi:hypothetical protein
VHGRVTRVEDHEVAVRRGVLPNHGRRVAAYHILIDGDRGHTCGSGDTDVQVQVLQVGVVLDWLVGNSAARLPVHGRHRLVVLLAARIGSRIAQVAVPWRLVGPRVGTLLGL